MCGIISVHIFTNLKALATSRAPLCVFGRESSNMRKYITLDQHHSNTTAGES
jgi:hypothetical protein